MVSRKTQTQLPPLPTSVVKIARTSGHKPHHPKEPPPHDNVFFTKEQIRVGTVLMCVGRLTYNTRWRVTKITPDYRNRHPRKDNLDRVMYLLDTVHLELMGVRLAEQSHWEANRRMSFACLSYSAIWRLAGAN